MNGEQEVRAFLRREADDVDPRPVPWAQVRRRAAEARRARLMAGVSLAAAVTAFAVFTSSRGGEGVQRVEVTDRSTEAPPPPQPGPTEPGPPTTADLAPPTTAPAGEAGPTTTAVTGGGATTTTAVASATTTTTGVPPATTIPPAQPDPACTAPEGGTDQPVTQADFEARIAQAWKACGTASVFGTSEAGLEIRADHRWSKLAAAADGRFLRLAGWGNEGTWESVDTSAMNGPGRWQLNLKVDGGGTVSTLPVFARDVAKVRLDNTGVHVADYVRLPDGSIDG